jgi:P-type Cu2+ transporter
LPLPPDLVFVSDEVTTVALGSAQGWMALITLGDTLRPEALRVVQALLAQGRDVRLLSGDRAPCVARVAQRLGVHAARGGATPDDKLSYVRDLQRRGAVVAVAGDGINDAPVLAQAQVSIAMASGTALAQLSADVALLTDSLEALLDAVNIARRTLRIIHQNFAWAVVYNVIAVPLAVMGLVTPWAAALGMSLSSLLVIGNALRLYDVRLFARQGD